MSTMRLAQTGLRAGLPASRTLAPLASATSLRPLLPLVPLLARGFSQSPQPGLIGPYKYYQRPSATSRLLQYVPQPIKVFGAISIGAALTVLLAPALIILLAPPLILGLMFYRRRAREFAKLMQAQRWGDSASYQFTYDQPNQAKSDAMPFSARACIVDAIRANNHQLESILQVSPEDVKFTPVESMYQDFQKTNSGMEGMHIQQYGLLDSQGNRLATVELVIQGDAADPRRKMRIEIRTRGSRNPIVLKPPQSSDNMIIDVK